MGTIHILDTHTADLIAAGEVVDRPAAAVKELLENAIDAGATVITVEIKRGGISFIRITDNGCGIAREDVPVALKRHATSKIRGEEDLACIGTLGFRGEALAAISAVSKVRILTKRKEDATGTSLVAHGGTVQSVEEAGCPDGTTIVVEELFYNTPARLKFLKRDGAETGMTASVVEKIALSRPDISFRFLSDGELRFLTNGDGKRESAVYAVLGRDFSRKIAEVRGGYEGISVNGFVGTPECVRGNRNYQFFFLNGRSIRSKTVSSALEQAFATFIPSEKFPCAVLYLKINPALVDVNVHPTKLEVKFSDERKVFDAVYYAVRGLLETSLKRPELTLSQKERITQLETVHAFAPGKEGRGGEAPVPRKDIVRTMEEVARMEVPSSVPQQFSSQTESPRPSAPSPSSRSGPVRGVTEDLFEDPVVPPSPVDGTPKAPQKTEIVSEKSGPQSSPAVPVERAAQTSEAPVSYRFVGELFQCYLIAEAGDTVYLIDKHAAHERILFEDFKKTAKQEEQPPQILLIPVEISLTPAEISTVTDFRSELEASGYAFSVRGNVLSLEQIPSFLDPDSATDAFLEACSGLSDSTGNARLTREIRFERALFQASCKAAVKAGRNYEEEDLRWICDRVLSDPAIRYCPHGRPVCFTVTKSRFEREFGRT